MSKYLCGTTLALIVLERASGHRRKRVFTVVVVLTASFVAVRLFADDHPSWSRSTATYLARTYEILASDPIPGSLPIAIAAPTMFPQVYHYAPPEIAARVVYLSNPKAAAERLGTDSADSILDRLSRAVGWPVRPEAHFRSQHDRFLIYDAPNAPFSWLRGKIVDEGKRLVPLVNDRHFSLWLCCEEVADE